MSAARRAPDLVPNPRPRTPRFRPPRGPALLGLYPIHTALAGAVAGLLAGPRAPEVVAALVALGCAAALVVVRSGAAFSVALEQADDAELERLVPVRPSAVTVPAARVAGALVLAVVAVAGGAVVAQARLRALDRTVLVPHAGARLTGIVQAPPRAAAFGRTETTVRVGGEAVLVRAPVRVRVPALRIGDEVAVRGRLRAPRAFDRRLGRHGVLDAERVAATGRRRDTPVDRARRRAEDGVAAGLAPETAALARGMVLGEDEALPEDLRDAFRVAGLAHLVAASGQNVMLLASLVLAVATAAGVMLRARLALALAAVVFYVPLAGAGPSIQRAGIMGAAGLGAALAGRPASRAYALLVAAAGTLVLNPRAAENVGWQLSFAAVVAILALFRRLSLAFGAEDPAPLDTRARRGAAGPAGTPEARRSALRAALAPGGAVRAPLAEVAALTVAATAGTAPLMCATFGQLSLVSLPANVLAAPAVAPVMWLGALSAVLGGPAATALNALAALPLSYLAWLGRAAAAVPHASVTLHLPGPVALVAVYATLAAVCAVRLGERQRAWLVRSGLARRAERSIAEQAAGEAGGLRPRWSAIAPLGVVVLAAGALAAPGPPRPPSEPTLTALDVGQGDALLLQDGERAALFDAGPPGAPIVAELHRAGVRRLDVVVITHSADDHAGGLPAVLAALPVGMVLDGRGPGLAHGGEGAGARFDGLPRSMPRAATERGQRFAVGRIAVDILWPKPGDPRLGEPNDTATVALARTRERSVLLTADAESNVTLGLDLPPVDVLQVAHHGSADEGLPALLERLHPSTAVIPVGPNTYGHPAPATVATLRSVVGDVRRTDRDGTVRVPLTGRAPG